jgi:hypothetical protein
MARPPKFPPIVFRGLPAAAFELLQEIPHASVLDDPAAGERLFPSPGEAEGLGEDWKSLVEPELHDLFRSARETVEADLQAARHKPDGVELQVPRHHVDAWLCALNQVRLALAAAHQLGEAEISAHDIPVPDSPSGQALLRIHFFGQLQEALLASIEEN